MKSFVFLTLIAEISLNKYKSTIDNQKYTRVLAKKEKTKQQPFLYHENLNSFRVNLNLNVYV